MDENSKMVSIDIDLDYTNEYIAQLLGFESSFDLERYIVFCSEIDYLEGSETLAERMTPSI